MSGDTEDLITALRLTEATADPALQDARNLALQYLQSKAPIPQTVMTVIERGASHPAPVSATANAATTATVPTRRESKGESDEYSYKH